MRARRAVAVALSTLVSILVACADGALPPRAANDPANPAASESPWSNGAPATHSSASSAPTPSGSMDMPMPSGSMSMPMPSGSSSVTATVWACPMGHGNFPGPGKCPVCGMTLVERPAGAATSKP